MSTAVQNRPLGQLIEPKPRVPGSTSLGRPHDLPSKATAWPAGPVAMQNVCRAHETDDRPCFASTTTGFSQRSPSYVRARPCASTATQNAGRGHEMAWKAPPRWKTPRQCGVAVAVVAEPACAGLVDS